MNALPRLKTHTLALLRHPLFAAAIIIIAARGILDSFTYEKPSARQEYERVLGEAVLNANPKILTSMDSKDLIITIPKGMLDGTAATLLLKHGLSEEDFQRLRQDLKK